MAKYATSSSNCNAFKSHDQTMIAITNFSESHIQQQQLLQICTHLQIEFCNL